MLRSENLTTAYLFIKASWCQLSHGYRQSQYDFAAWGKCSSHSVTIDVRTEGITRGGKEARKVTPWIIVTHSNSLDVIKTYLMLDSASGIRTHYTRTHIYTKCFLH